MSITQWSCSNPIAWYALEKDHTSDISVTAAYSDAGSCDENRPQIQQHVVCFHHSEVRGMVSVNS